MHAHQLKYFAAKLRIPLANRYPKSIFLLFLLAGITGYGQQATAPKGSGEGTIQEWKAPWKGYQVFPKEQVGQMLWEGRRPSTDGLVEPIFQFEHSGSKPSFEAILVQDMSFGNFQAGPGGGGIFLEPSGAIQTKGSIAILDRRLRPAIFQISTDSVRLLEVWLPEAFNLENGGDSHILVVRPFTDLGTGRFFIELRPRPHLNFLHIGGELTVMPPGTSGKAGRFSSAFRIEFVPLYAGGAFLSKTEQTGKQKGKQK